MSYYVINAEGKPEGPYPAEWVRANATPTTMVSHQQRWVQYSLHPDFVPAPPVPPVPQPPQAAAPAPPVPPVPPVWSPSGRAALSPHLSLLNLMVPGMAQIIFGQTGKGLLCILIYAITFVTVLGPVIMAALTIVDGYKVADKLHRTGSVGAWEFFPS